MTFRRTFLVFIFVVLAVFTNTAQAISTTVVISQVYGAGGNSGAVRNADYVELFNRGTTPQSLNGWSVQYASATGTGNFASVSALPNVTLQPGQYFLLGGTPGANGAALPTPDAPLVAFMGAGAGKVILANTTTALACNGSIAQPCSGAQLAQIIDLVGYGNANFFEGAGAAPTISAILADFRGASGCTETDNNNADFATGTPAPRNTATTLAPCTPPLPTLDINDVTLSEADGGTTIFTFDVTLSAPAGPAGVVFDIATADGTAQDDNPAGEDEDYLPNSLTGQSIPMGSSGPYNFSVTVNGDVDVEADETFFVNVTNITGATAGDTQGQGTIENDDVPCASLSIDDVTQVETNGATTTFAFTVSLSQAGCGTVTFDIATADGTAQDGNPGAEDNDYVAQSLTGQTITFPSTYTFNVTVNGDATQEPDQTFFVNLTNVSPANVLIGDAQGLGTIVNDDFTRIHDIQGPGGSSPIVGASVTTRGIVTGRKSNGYYIQEPDASVDADPATSEGIFVFTSSAPPAAAAVGNSVEVTATVVEFVPTADLLQPPLTELSSPTTVQLSTGNPLPTPIPLNATFPDPAGPFDQLERLEGMRVSVASLTVSGPTLGNSVSEANATQTSNGVFFGTVTGVARPAREAGIQAPDPAPSGGSIPPIPRFDANPEMIRVDSDGLVGAPILDVNSLATVTGLIGPLDYTFRHYTILPDPTLPAPVATGGMTATSATAPTSKELTVAAYNVERFFDTVNDPGIGEPVLTATAYDNRLNKISLGIRNHLLMPDIIGMIEVENLSTLQDIAARISTDAIAAAQPDPQYDAYLVEGNDVGGIDVGFLVKTAIVTGATPRVTVNTVVQENAGELFVNADSSTEFLNDRPPLRLDAVVNAANGATFPITVIVVHQRSLIGVNDESAGSSGWPTVGSRVRAKRLKQSESLANLIQTRQTNDPSERIVLVGDFNAYEFNDGLTDVLNVIHGTPPPDDETAVPGDGVDLVSPDLDNLFDTPPPGERYSYVFDGQMQNIDHGIVNAALIAATTARRLEHPRINTDFRAVDRNDANTARHLSDHDPLVGYFEVAAFASADVSITKSDNVDPVNAGQNFFYTITVDNAGPDSADDVSWSDPLPAGTTFVSLSSPGGWSCTTPAVGATGTVTCSIASLGVGNAAFTLTVAVDASLASGTVLSNTATVASTATDPNPGNESDPETTTVATSADVAITKTDSPDPVDAGTNLTYTITVTNNGPSNAANASWTDTLPAGTTFVSLSSPGGWSCTTPAVGANGTVTCSIASLGVVNAGFTLVANVDSSTAAGTVLSNTANVSSTTFDPTIGNEGATETTTVVASADLQVTKVDSPDPVSTTGYITYTMTVTNAGPSDAASVNLSDTLPAGTTFLTLTGAASGWSCGTPGVGGTGTINCSIAAFPSGGSAIFTFLAEVNDALPNGTVITNTATVTSTTTDPDGGNNSAMTTTAVGPITGFTVTKTVSGTFVQGTDVTYTVTLTNDFGFTQQDNFGHEFTDNLPAGLTLVSANASSGTMGSVSNIVFWDGSIPNGTSVTITITATIDATTSGTISNQGQAILDTDNDGANESSLVTDDPATAAPNDATSFAVIQANEVTATKSVSGTFTQGTDVSYTIVVTNDMGIAQPDNAGDELTDVLPASLTLVSATATSGTAVANVGTNTVTWNGALPAGASTTITVTATIDDSATGTVSNQASLAFDADGNGSNESAGVSDDPGTGAADDPTVFTIVVTDSDGDGVDDVIEQAAPNGGDGNGDGIPDHTQSSVASIPAATGSGYLTLQSSCPLEEVYVTTEDAMPIGDHGHHYPHGMIAFRAPCTSATFSLFIYGSGAVSSYRKYGPLPPGGPAQWYQLPGATFQVVTVGSLHPRRVDFSLTDGGTGDDTPVDGVIVDQGGPADPDAAIPTLSEWALIALAMAMAAFAALKLRA